MPLYFYLSIVLLIIIFFIRSFVLQRKNIPVGLFDIALRDENNGQFAEAVINYENALQEVKKTKFQGDLKNKIIAKLTVLHTIIEYQKNCHLPGDIR